MKINKKVKQVIIYICFVISCALGSMIVTLFLIFMLESIKSMKADNGKPPVVTRIPSDDPNTFSFHIDRLDPGESIRIELPPIIISDEEEVKERMKEEPSI